MHFLDIYLRDGKLDMELHGRVVWCIHSLRGRGCDIKADFPDIHHLGLGYRLRAFGSQDDLTRLVEMTAPLEQHQLIRLSPIEPVPESASGWVVTFRRSNDDFSRLSASRARRLIRRAKERGEPEPDLPLDERGRLSPDKDRSKPAHNFWMRSSNTDTVFSIAVARQSVPGPDALPKGRDRWPGNGYGFGFVVPDFSLSTSAEELA